MSFIRSVYFWLLFYISVFALVTVYFAISVFIKRKNFADECAKIWAQFILFSLRLIHKIDHQIIGIDKLPQTPCIIACKHQSAWETIVFHLLCRHPAYIYKKELLKVPFYGWFVAQMTGAQVDRSGGAFALKNLIKQTKSILQKGHNIVIFPQGTRAPFGSSVEQYPYQVGIAALYLACNVPVIPVALNSGKFWGKSMIIKKSGTIKLEFLEPIQAGLNKENFMNILEARIEEASAKL